MKKLLLSALPLALSVGISAADGSEKGPSWNFLELGYVQGDIDGIDVDPSGFGGGFSFLVTENVFLSGSYTSISDDVQVFSSNVEVELNQSSVGFGFRIPTTDYTDFFIGADYINAEVCGAVSGLGGECLDDNGYGLNLGMRSMLTEQFEFFITAGYVDIADESETSTSLGVAYNITDAVALQLGWSTAEDVDLIGLSVRFDF